MKFFIQGELYSDSILYIINTEWKYYHFQLNLYHIMLFCHISNLDIFFSVITELSVQTTVFFCLLITLTSVNVLDLLTALTVNYKNNNLTAGPFKKISSSKQKTTFTNIFFYPFHFLFFYLMYSLFCSLRNWKLTFLSLGNRIFRWISTTFVC